MKGRGRGGDNKERRGEKKLERKPSSSLSRFISFSALASALWRLLLRLGHLVQALFHLLLEGLGEAGRGLGQLGLLRRA